MAIGKKKRAKAEGWRFGRGKGSAGQEQGGGLEALDETMSSRKRPARRENEKLSSVMNESTQGPALDRIRSNEAFVIDVNGDREGIIFMVDTDDLGGLNKKVAQGSEEKGSFLQLVRAEQINVIATEEMLEAEEFAIIPNAQTMDRLQEFTMMRMIPYEVVHVDLADFSMHRSGVTTEFDLIERVSDPDDDYEVMDLIGSLDVEDEPGSAEEPAQDEQETAGTAGTEQAAPTEEGGYGVLPGDEDEEEEPEAPAAAPAPEQPEPLAEPLAEGEVDADYEDEMPGGPLDEDEGIQVFDVAEDEAAPAVDPDPEDQEHDEDEDGAEPAPTEPSLPPVEGEVTSAEQMETIARRMQDADLALEVPLLPFEVQFGSVGVPVAFPVPEQGTWADQVLGPMYLQANAELESAHRAGVDAIRQGYVGSLSRIATSIMADCATNNPATPFGAEFAKARQAYNEETEQHERQTAEARRKLQEEFEEEARRVGEVARVNAENAFRQQRRPRLDRQLSEAGQELASQAMTRLHAREREINVQRREEAASAMDLSMTKALEVAAGDYRDLLDRLGRMQKELAARIEQHAMEVRRDDVARTTSIEQQEALREELASARARADQMLHEAQTRGDDRVKALQAQLADAKADAEARVSTLRAQMEEALAAAQRETLEERQARELAERELADTDARVGEKYEDEVSNLSSQIERYRTDYEQEVQNQAAMNRRMIVMFIVIAVVALLVGAVTGMLLF